MTGMTSRFRMDFVVNVVSSDDANRTATFELLPDPRRYEWQDSNGERCLYDRLDKILIPEAIVQQLVKDMAGHAITFEPQEVKDAAEYVRSRRPNIASALKDGPLPPTFADPSDDFLATLDADNTAFVILSLDIIGSTELATRLPQGQYAKIIQTVLFEVSHTIPLFRGHVLKYTGDGVIAYFPAPSFITKNDLALDCALTLRRLINDGINPELQAAGREHIGIRIGLDSGEASVVVIGSPLTKQQNDVVGATVSLACKIQSRAPMNGIALGAVTYQNLHTHWRLACLDLEVGEDWPFNDPETGLPYRAYFVQLA